MATIDTYVTRAFREKVSHGGSPKNTLQEFLQSVYGNNGRSIAKCEDCGIAMDGNFRCVVRFMLPGLFFSTGFETFNSVEGKSLSDRNEAAAIAYQAALNLITVMADKMRNVSQAPMQSSSSATTQHAQFYKEPLENPRDKLKLSIANTRDLLQLLEQQLQEVEALIHERDTGKNIK